MTVPLSELQIAHTLFGVKYGGSTMTEVHFLGWPWMMNGMEVAELNAKFSDGTIWFLRFVYDPQNKDWSDYAPFQVSSFQSQRGLSQPFPANEATVAGAEGKAS
ncbi:MAG TPA: hypothetical protein VLX31_04755 [Streptosporangiaceae bacterium]|nr:hypothetical protein [Streptosporangiaceae bacterium]